MGGDVGADAVVAAAENLHERASGSQDPRRAVALQAAHRPRPGLQPPGICLDGVVRVLLDGVQGGGANSPRTCGYVGARSVVALAGTVPVPLEYSIA